MKLSLVLQKIENDLLHLRIDTILYENISLFALNLKIQK